MSEKKDRFESRLAKTLLASPIPPRAELMCVNKRHHLGSVYFTPDGVRYLAVPERKFLAKSLFLDDPNPERTVLLNAWAADIDDDNEGRASILLRCHCGMFSTNIRRIRRQLQNLPRGDNWLLVGRSLPADDPHSIGIREGVARADAILAAIPKSGAVVTADWLASTLDQPERVVRTQLAQFEDDGLIEWLPPADSELDLWELRGENLRVRRLGTHNLA